MEVSDASSDLQGWIYAIAAGGACILGATVVFWDIILRKIPFVGRGHYGDISHSASFQVASMSLGSGVLLFSALRNLVPQAENYFDSPLIHHTIRNAGGLITIACFFLGVALCIGLSDLIHRYTPESIVHCGDHEEDQDQDKVSSGFEENTVIPAADSQASRRTGPFLPFPGSGRLARTTSLTHTSTRDRTGSGGQDCSLGYATDQALDYPKDTHSFINSSSRRPASRALSHADVSSKSRHQHYHQGCGRSGVCAGYTAPCFSASCVCDGHEVTRPTTWPKLMPSQKDSLDRTIFDRNADQSAFSSRSTIRMDLEANEQTPLFRKARPQLAGGSTPREDVGEDERSESSHSHHGDPPVHHHHHNDDSSKMLRIGISTSIAICLHKAPEGFITFISAHADRQLGLTLFLAIALHNVSEGAVIAYPLFVATGSRTKAFVWASLLGGLSGPLGALIGFILTRSGFLHRDDSWTPIVYGTLFAIVAGFMSTIAIQSMLPAAIKEDRTNTRATTIWFSVGVGIIALAGALTK